ncbi:MAG: AroM family protein [Sporosarcina sp.]
MKKNLCILTIGQSPRVDMVSAITMYLPKDTSLVEKGVLDELSIKEIEAIQPKDSKETLVTRLRDGSSVTLDKHDVISSLKRMIDDYQKNDIGIILLACTGKFESFESDIPIVYPDYLLSHVVKGLFKEGEIGVVIPLQEQSQSIMEKWNEAGFTCSVLACSPYDYQTSKLIHVAREMDKLPVKAIVLDCMGYTDEMKKVMVAHTAKPVLVARNVVFSSLAEML